MSKTTPFVQASFRLTPETSAAIRDMAIAKGVSQSEVMRAATTLLKHTQGLSESLKLAVVDVQDHKDTDYYRVKQWIVE